MKKKIVRAFLNLPTHCHGAHARTSVDNDGRYGIEIHDCQNRAYLHGRFEQIDDYKNALLKIDTLVNVLQETRANIEQARQEILEKKAKRKKKKEALPETKPFPKNE